MDGGRCQWATGNLSAPDTGRHPGRTPHLVVRGPSFPPTPRELKGTAGKGRGVGSGVPQETHTQSPALETFPLF